MTTARKSQWTLYIYTSWSAAFYLGGTACTDQWAHLGYVGEEASPDPPGVSGVMCQGRSGSGRMISSISSPSTRHRGLWLSASPSDFPTGTQWNQYKCRAVQNRSSADYRPLCIITKNTWKYIYLKVNTVKASRKTFKYKYFIESHNK